MLLPVLICLGSYSCNMMQKKINWSVTLKKGDPNPYGGKIGYESLKLIFPGAKISALSSGFRFEKPENDYSQKKNLWVLSGLNFNTSDEELKEIISLINQGDIVILFAAVLSTNIQDYLHIHKRADGYLYEEMPAIDKEQANANQHILKLSDRQLYGMPGRTLRSYFAIHAPKETATTVEPPFEEDYINDQDILLHPPEEVYPAVAGHPEIIGRAVGRPDYLQYKIGKGQLLIHCAPLVMSNYFLLQPENKNYYEQLWTPVNGTVDQVYFIDYYKRTGARISFGLLLKYKNFQIAFLLTIITLLLYILFDMKRRQRVIPVIPPVENATVSFVQTVGKLYYNKADHANLAEKMIQHFLEWVRLNYYLNTSEINQQFEEQLQKKSGRSDSFIRGLIAEINYVKTGGYYSQEQLTELYKMIHSFYKKQKANNG